MIPAKRAGPVMFISSQDPQHNAIMGLMKILTKHARTMDKKGLKVYTSDLSKESTCADKSSEKQDLRITGVTKG